MQFMHKIQLPWRLIRLDPLANITTPYLGLDTNILEPYPDNPFFVRCKEQILRDPFMTDPFIEHTCKYPLGVIGAYHLFGKEVSIHGPPV